MGMERKVLIIDGMTCINCQNKIEQELKNTAGISKVQVSYSKGQAEIEFNPEIVTLNRIAAIIEKLDYTVIDKKQADSLKWVRRIGTLAVIILLSVTAFWYFKFTCSVNACRFPNELWHALYCRAFNIRSLYSDVRRDSSFTVYSFEER